MYTSCRGKEAKNELYMKESKTIDERYKETHKAIRDHEMWSEPEDCDVWRKDASCVTTMVYI